MKSWKTPTPEQVKKAVALLGRAEQYRYFFNRLENPRWITPLKEKRFFQNPPQVIRDDSEGTASFPVWPESRYLARMAAHEPDVVLEIALQIQTDNPGVYEDFVEAGLQMPPEVAVKLVSKVKTWIEESPYLSYSLLGKVGALMARLAKEGQVEKALELAHSLLMPSSMNNREAGENQVYRLPPEPQVRFDNWQYEQILKKYVPELVTVAGENALNMLCGLLNDAINFSWHSAGETKKQEDNSPIWEDGSRYWRFAIKEHHRNISNKVKELLVSAVRDAAEQIVESNPAKMRSLVLVLEKWRWRVFHRIALYLLGEFPNADRELLFERLVDQKRFKDDSSYEDYEYALLLKEYFPQLPGEEQKKILSWIENPDLDLPWQDELEKKAGWVRYWQLKKLTPLKDNLPANWQQRYNQLVNEFDAVELSEIVSGGVGEFRVVGVVSPKTDSELDSMSIEELVSFLRTWEPKSTDPFEEPSRRGLASALVRLAENNPQRYAQAAEKFQGLHSEYLWHLLWGLQTALNNQKGKPGEQKEFPWLSILSLCCWIVEESEKIQESQTTDIDRDLNWREARRIVAAFFGVGLTLEVRGGIPFHLRSEVWNCLITLTQDPDPTPKHEAHGTNMEPSTLSINTVRGEAMHTVVRYALWIRRHFEQMADGAGLIGRGFDEMPEVRQVLDAHLNPDQEPSLAIRSVYGQWFPWLTLLAPGWAVQSVTKIFPSNETLSDLHNAAWETYITLCPIYNNVFEMLYEEYSYAVERINAAPREKRNLADNPNQSLVQHLMTLYCRGKLDLNEPGGLLVRFHEKAPDALRGHALEFVGRSLRNTQEKIEPQILNQLQLLWEQRLEAARTATSPASHANELAAFGWWFASGKFDDSWAIAHLKEVLELVGKVEPDHLVVERLAALTDAMPELTVECLRLIIEGDKKGWSIYGWPNEAKTILVTALQGNNDTAIQTAKALIHKLGERGYWEFRELLSVGEK